MRANWGAGVASPALVELQVCSSRHFANIGVRLKSIYAATAVSRYFCQGTERVQSLQARLIKTPRLSGLFSTSLSCLRWSPMRANCIVLLADIAALPPRWLRLPRCCWLWLRLRSC